MFFGQLKLAYSPEADIADYNHNVTLLNRSVFPVGVLSAIGLGILAHHGMTATDQADKIDKKQTEDWAKKYLTGPSKVTPVEGMGNASYQKVDGVHQIKYDPTFNKSVAAHEIGHGMSSFPRVPFGEIIGPVMLGWGAKRVGQSLGLDKHVETGDLSLLGAGALALTPTLIDEWMASHNAKKILGEQGVKPRGLTRAWLTYAAPVGIAGAVGLTSYLLAHGLNERRLANGLDSSTLQT